MKCPCEKCISFAICYNIRSVKCSDLLYYLHADQALLWNRERLNRVELLFKKSVDHTIGILNITVFKQREG